MKSARLMSAVCESQSRGTGNPPVPVVACVLVAMLIAESRLWSATAITSDDFESPGISLDGTAADGTTYHEIFDGKADGKSYPIMRDNKEFAQVTYRWVNDNAVTALIRIPDGTVTSEKVDLAPDGKTMTLHLHSKSKAGKVLADEVGVFRKQ